MLVKAAVLLLTMAALGGLLMAGMRLSGRDRPPDLLAMGHGLAAAAGLVLLLYAAVTVGAGGMIWIGVAVLALAAMGGIYLNRAFHSKKLALPKAIVLGHGATALVGISIICVGAFK